MQHLAALLFAFCLFLVLIGCVDQRPDTAAASVISDSLTAAGVDADPTDGNLDLYPVDAEDPYLIHNGSFLGIRPGDALSDHRAGLRDGTILTGNSGRSLYYLDGAEGEELGYLLTAARAPDAVGSLVITSRDVVTEEGLRVGMSELEIMERLGSGNIAGGYLQLPFRDGFAPVSLKFERRDGERQVTEILVGERVTDLAL